MAYGSIKVNNLVYDTGSGDTTVAVSGISTGTADKVAEGNTELETVDTGSDGHIKLTTEGSERLRVIADGKVGIGMTAPTSTLHITGTARVSQAAVADAAAVGDASTITLDLSTSTNFTVTTDSSTQRTLGNPTGETVGQSGTIVVIGSGFSGFGSQWIWPGGTAYTATNATNKIDVLHYYVYAADKILLSSNTNYDVS